MSKPVTTNRTTNRMTGSSAKDYFGLFLSIFYAGSRSTLKNVADYKWIRIQIVKTFNGQDLVG